MPGRPHHPWIPLVLALLALASPGAGCQSQPTEPQAPPVVGPQLFDCIEKKEEDPAVCRHVWLQVDVHVYTRVRDGIPSMDLCSVLRCHECGQIRHECRPAPRR